MTKSIINKFRFVAIVASVLLVLLVWGCSSGGSNNSNSPIVTQGGKVTRDTLVSFIRHYGKLNVLEKSLSGEIVINDTSKIKKLLGDYYPLWADKYFNRILKVPYDVYVKIGFDLGEIAFSVKEVDEGKFTVAKPTPIVDITGIIIRFDKEYRDIGTLRFDVDSKEFAEAWQDANVPELIKSQVCKERKDEFIDAVLAQTVSDIVSRVRRKYKNIDFKFETVEQAPVFSEIPTPKIESK